MALSSTPFTHYVVVRRDLPFGVIVAQIAHAAGESFFQLASHTWTVPSSVAAPMAGGMCPSSSVSERQVFNLEVGGVSPSWGSNFTPAETIAVVLGARNEHRLRRLVTRLIADNVTHAAITETDGQYQGQMMAIGLMPGPKDALTKYVNEFHMFTTLEVA